MIRLHRLMRAVAIVETRRLVVRTSHALAVRSQTSVALSGTPCSPCMLQESAQSDGMHCGRCVESHVFVWAVTLSSGECVSAFTASWSMSLG